MVSRDQTKEGKFAAEQLPSNETKRNPQFECQGERSPCCESTQFATWRREKVHLPNREVRKMNEVMSRDEEKSC
jgi:hypothetical protein